MADEHKALAHTLTLNERHGLRVTGVTEVVSFEETAAVLQTAAGTLIVQGQGLQLKSLSPDGGNVSVEGTVSALSYEEPHDPGGWLRRLFG